MRIRVELDARRPAGVKHNVSVLLQAVALYVFLRPNLYWIPASLPFLRLGETLYSTEFSVGPMGAVQAALLVRWKERLLTSQAARADRIAEILDTLTARHLRPAVPAIRLPILCESRAARDRLLDESEHHGLGFGAVYPTDLSEIPALRGYCDGRTFPNAARLAGCLLTVPVHPFVTDDDARQICSLLGSVLNAGAAS